MLFARITAQIRDLSREFIETHDDRIMEEVEQLYHYVMVDQRGLFRCARLYDHSEDRDGIVEEAFSEIGKPQRQPLALIYQSRVNKIGAAMAAIYQVASLVVVATGSAQTELKGAIYAYAEAAARLTGLPTFDALAYDRAAITYVNSYDILREMIGTLALSIDMKRLKWIYDSMRLIDSMQSIRDERPNSIADLRARAAEWM